MIAARKTKVVSRSRAHTRSRAIAADEGSPAQVLRRFRLVFNAVKAHFRDIEKKVGLGGAQVWALSLIREQPGIGVGQLARAMDIQQSTASNLVRSLVEAQLAVAERNGVDRRTVQLRLLPDAARVLRRAPKPFSGLLPQALARLDAKTLARLHEDLGRLIDLLGISERHARTPLGQRSS